ncbi:MAG TPA: hypothetical protein VIB48_00895 [Acidimicrobiia bacterium]|jgi:hypothetical protein
MTRVRWIVVFAVALFALALPATAWAARAADTCPYPGTTCPSTSVAPENAATTAPSNVLGENASTGSNSSLPFTGGDIAGLTAIGGGAIVVGVLLARARKADSRS